jgi:hypothetical protein
VQADGQHARQGEQPGEKGEKLGKKGSARGRASRPLTLGDFLPGGRLVGHQQRYPVDKPCVGQRVSSPSHGPVLTEASLAAWGHFQSRRLDWQVECRTGPCCISDKGAGWLDGDPGRGATLSAQRWSSLLQAWRHLLVTRRPLLANHLQKPTAETTTSTVWWSGRRLLSTTSRILVLSSCAA